MKRKLPHARIVVALAACAFLGACAESQLASYSVKEAASTDKATGQYKIGKPYQINGVWYYPAVDYNYSETGIASWYGPGFHSQYTANGEIYDENEITAAHRTLPMPSFVRVTNLENGRTLVVRVNDRGPYAHGRILDLSRHAAQLLGIEERGTARVQVDIMADESRAIAERMGGNSSDEPPVASAPRESVKAASLPPPGSHEESKPIVKVSAPERQAVGSGIDEPHLDQQAVRVVAVKSTQIYVQAGAFSRYDNANRANAALNGFGHTSITQVQTKSGILFRVRTGPLANVSDADALLEKIISSGYPDAKIVVD